MLVGFATMPLADERVTPRTPATSAAVLREEATTSEGSHSMQRFMSAKFENDSKEFARRFQKVSKKDVGDQRNSLQLRRASLLVLLLLPLLLGFDNPEPQLVSSLAQQSKNEGCRCQKPLPEANGAPAFRLKCRPQSLHVLS